MSSIGTGYDLSSTTYSPDGRVFQVEYAGKAVDNSGTAVGIRVADGVVFGVEKLLISPMLLPGSNRRVNTIGRHIGVASSGLVADARALINRGNQEAMGWKSTYGEEISVKALTARLAGFAQVYTLYGGVRPFGCALILGSWSKAEGGQLYMIQPSGDSFGYFGCAAGKGKASVKTEIEKLDLASLTCEQAVVEVAKMIHNAHDEEKDKEYELELSWVCEASNGRHELVPAALREQAISIATAESSDDTSSDDE